MDDLFDFSIVVPTYNNTTELESCLNALLKQKELTFEVLICEDGSDEPHVEFCHRFASQQIHFSILQHPDKKNKGRPANRNQSLGKLNGKYVLFLDSDMVANPDLLANHFEILKNEKCVSIGRVVYVDSDTNFWAKYLSSRGVGKHRETQKTRYQYFTTQNAAMPRQWFEELGGFDGSITGYGGDDTEFACRLHQTFNPKFIYNADALAISTMNKNWEKALDQLEEFGATSLKYIHKKHPDCKEIFRIELFTRKDFKHNVFKWLSQKAVYDVFLFLSLKTPSFIGLRLFNFCVAYRIFKGFCSKD